VTSRLKVLNVLEEGRWGGPQKRVLLVARELKQYGIETIVVIPKMGTKLFQQKLEENNISFYAINLHRITRDRKHLFSYIYYFRKEIRDLNKIIEKESIDLVHANGSFQFKAIFAANRTNRKSVWHLNDTYVVKPIKILFEKYMKYKTDGFFVAGERVRSYYLPKNPNNKIICSITPPVDMSVYDPKLEFENVLDTSVINVTLIANWSQIKGHGTYIKMAKYVSNKNIGLNINFNIVGKIIENQVPYFNRMQELIKSTGLSNIKVLGQRQDVMDILKATDISICSSNFEASPTTVWEAMAMEKPIVSTDVGDVKPYLQIYNCGYFVDVGDYEAMGDKVIKLVNDPELRKQMGVKARRAALDNFGLESIVDKHAKVYRLIHEK